MHYKLKLRLLPHPLSHLLSEGKRVTKKNKAPSVAWCSETFKFNNVSFISPLHISMSSK